MSLTSQFEKWVDEVAALTGPAKIAWADGSKAEYDALVDDHAAGRHPAPPELADYPNCYLHRSHPSDVARTEQLTLLCTPTSEEAGPTNNLDGSRGRQGSGSRGCSAAACAAARCG